MFRAFALSLMVAVAVVGCKPAADAAGTNTTDPGRTTGGATGSGGAGSGASSGGSSGAAANGGSGGGTGGAEAGTGGATNGGGGTSVSASGGATAMGSGGGSGGSPAGTGGGAGGATAPDAPTAPTTDGPEPAHIEGRPDLKLCGKDWTPEQCCAFLCNCLNTICSDSPKGKPGLATCMNWCPKISNMARRCHVYHCYVSVSPTGGIKDHDSHCGHAADQVAGGGCPTEVYQ
jgi:hypothetical protein